MANGGADPLVPSSQMSEFVTHMSAASVYWPLQVYAAIQHSFTNPDR